MFVMRQLKSPFFVLKSSSPAAIGVVAGVSTYLASRGCYISELAQFDDQESGSFFMRAVCEVRSETHTAESIQEGFYEVAEQFGMTFSFYDAKQPVKTLIMVSEYDHCLDDLLYRHRKGELAIEISAIVSNHLTLRPMAEREGIRFIYLPVNKENKAEQEEALMKVVNETDTDLVILARYMQILSDKLCDSLQGRAINIHHSFLPGFKGARPYHQAYHRGVKLIGATAHYVTADLDEGPIIYQSVQSVDHTYGPKELTAMGRDTETVALAKAVKLHTEHRVFLDGNKTVIFS
jgi:formyltetrahydrofolate deformylase